MSLRKLGEIVSKLRSGGKLLLTGEDEEAGESSFLAPEIDKSYGERPIVDFATLINIYRSDPIIGPSVDFIWVQAVGSGFHTVMNKEAEKEKIKIKISIDGKDEELELNAKEAIDLFNEHIKLFEFLGYFIRDFWGMGNAFILNEDIFNPKYLPLDSIERICRGKGRRWNGEGGRYPIGYFLSSKYGGRLIPRENMIHERWNTINDEAFGTGIIQRMALKMPIGGGESRRELYRIMGSMQEAMIEQFELFSGPNELWNFPGIDDKNLRIFDAKVRALPRRGKRLTSNVKDARATPVVAERARGFDFYVKTMTDMYSLGTQTPMPKFLMSEGFSEAFAREIKKTMQPLIAGVRQRAAYMVEDMLWKPVLRHWGFDPIKTRVKLIWELPKVFEPELMIRMLPFLLRMLEINSMRTSEFRRIMRDILNLPLDADDDLGPITPIPKPGPLASPRTAEKELALQPTGVQEEP